MRTKVIKCFTAIIMTLNFLKYACASLTLVLLTACGGGAEPSAAPQAAPAAAAPAPARVLAAACDSTDCAPVIDGLAEQFRSSAQRAQVEAEAQASAAPAYPRVAQETVMAPAPVKGEAFGTEGQ
jgi:hypothetical protein